MSASSNASHKKLVDRIVRHIIHGRASPLGTDKKHAEKDKRHLRKQLQMLNEETLKIIEQGYAELEKQISS